MTTPDLRSAQIDNFMDWLFRDGGLEPPRREYGQVRQRVALFALASQPEPLDAADPFNVVALMTEWAKVLTHFGLEPEASAHDVIQRSNALGCANAMPSDMSDPNAAADLAMGCEDCGSPWWMHRADRRTR